MHSYLTSVLQGDVDLPLVKQWISEGCALPPAPSTVVSPRTPTSSDHWPQLTADHFRVMLLNHVKEEADKIFLAAECQAVALHTKATQAAKESEARHAASHAAAFPGLVNDSTFPSLNIKPTKVCTPLRRNVQHLLCIWHASSHVCRKMPLTEGSVRTSMLMLLILLAQSHTKSAVGRLRQHWCNLAQIL